MPNCSVLCCRSRSDIFNLHRGGVSYHRFPTDPDVKLKWIQATGRKNWHPVKKSTICSKHFVEWDYLKEVLRPKILKKGTVPSQRLLYTDDGNIFIDQMEIPETLDETVEDSALRCARCSRPFRARGPVLACLQCRGALCPACDARRAPDPHAQHCVVRVPSRLVYNKLKELWVSLQHEIAARLGGGGGGGGRCGADGAEPDSIGRKRRADSRDKSAAPAMATPAKHKPHDTPTDDIPTPKIIPKVKEQLKSCPKRETRNRIVNPFALLRDKASRRENGTADDVDRVLGVESEEIEVLMDVACFGDVETDNEDEIEEEPPDSESEEGEDPDVM